LAFPGDVVGACINIQEEEEEEEEDTPHVGTWSNARVWCGLNSWVVCIIDNFYDIRERNVAIRSGT
jgi:hypothetical protein